MQVIEGSANSSALNIYIFKAQESRGCLYFKNKLNKKKLTEDTKV